MMHVSDSGKMHINLNAKAELASRWIQNKLKIYTDLRKMAD
jgi:hypothetical protein